MRPSHQTAFEIFLQGLGQRSAIVFSHGLAAVVMNWDAQMPCSS